MYAKREIPSEYMKRIKVPMKDESNVDFGRIILIIPVNRFDPIKWASALLLIASIKLLFGVGEMLMNVSAIWSRDIVKEYSPTYNHVALVGR